MIWDKLIARQIELQNMCKIKEAKLPKIGLKELLTLVFSERSKKS